MHHASKGISVFIASALVIMLTVLVSAMVANWVPQTSRELTSSIRSQNADQLACSRASVFVKNATYNCSRSCASGTLHTLNITVQNLGAVSLRFGNLSVVTTTGRLYSYALNETRNLTIGETEVFTNVSSAECTYINHSIDSVRIASNNCGNAGDSYPGSLVEYIECG